MTHPAMFTSMTMASLWFVDFIFKSSSVNVIGTLAHSGRAATTEGRTAEKVTKMVVVAEIVAL
jgi:hypothetical protein